MNETIFRFALAVSFFVGTAVASGPEQPINFTSLSPGDSPGGKFPMALRLVGNVDGKSYFADSSIRRTWFQAKTYCESFGMKLASITSRNQADFFKRAYDSSYFYQSMTFMESRIIGLRHEMHTSFVNLAGTRKIANLTPAIWLWEEMGLVPATELA